MEMIELWFGPSSTWDRDTPGEMKNVMKWFKSDAELDKMLTEKYQKDIEELTKGNREDMRKCHYSSLCYILLGDQFARNVFRGKAAAFACAPRTESLAREILDDWKRYDRYVNYEKTFILLVLEHSENKDDTARAVEEFKKISESCPEDETIKKFVASAIDHHECVLKYGRYPARNLPLGRENTPEEQEYVDAGKGY